MTVSATAAPPVPLSRRKFFAGRSATLLSTASDEASTSLLPALLSVTLGSSHVPMLSHPQEVANVIIAAADNAK